MDLNKTIKTRKSVRKFFDKKPNYRKIIKAIDNARYAPRAGNHFITKFILVKDENKIQKISQACNQKFIKEAKYVVVVVSEDKMLTKLYDERGERYARQQTGAAIENFLLSLVNQNLATCWVGAFVDEQVKTILNIPEDDNIKVEALFPIGKETKSKSQRKKPVERDLDDILYFDKWNNKYMEPRTKLSMDAA